MLRLAIGARVLSKIGATAEGIANRAGEDGRKLASSRRGHQQGEFKRVPSPHIVALMAPLSAKQIERSSEYNHELQWLRDVEIENCGALF